MVVSIESLNHFKSLHRKGLFHQTSVLNWFTWGFQVNIPIKKEQKNTFAPMDAEVCGTADVVASASAGCWDARGEDEFPPCRQYYWSPSSNYHHDHHHHHHHHHRIIITILTSNHKQFIVVHHNHQNEHQWFLRYFHHLRVHYKSSLSSAFSQIGLVVFNQKHHWLPGGSSWLTVFPFPSLRRP